MNHDHIGDSHVSHAHAANERRLLWVMCLTGGFAFVEVVAGLYAGSLTLLADAGHMFTDAFGIALAWYAFRLSRRSHDENLTYGYHRFQVLAAFVNGLGVAVIAVWIVLEAIERLNANVAVLGLPVLSVALIGLVINAMAFAVLSGGGANLNVRGALLHVIGDLLGSVAALVAGAVILLTGWMPIDALLAMLVAVILVRSAWRLVAQAGHILLEGVPTHIDVDMLKQRLTQLIPAVEEVHHVHAWSLTVERPMVTLHARIREDADNGHIMNIIKHALRDEFGIAHSTVQLENGDCPDDR